MSNSPRSRFPWIPVIILAAAISGIFYVQSLPELERNLKSWMFAAIPLLTGILLLLWFLCSRRFTGKARLIGLGIVCVLALMAKLALRADGTVDGTGLPNVVWKWTSKKTPALSAVKTGGVSVADPKRLAEAADVPQFFGANRDGLVSGIKLDRDWKNHPPKELWRQPIGEGWSAFSVVQGRAFTQEQRGEEELGTCYDLWSGALLWAHSDRARFFQWQGGAGPRATPTVMDGRVYTYGGTGLLNCLDAATGKAIWQKSVLTENGLTNIEWGVSASPLIVGDLVIVTGGNPRGPVLFAYRRDTGDLAWKAGDDQATYASPILGQFGGKPVVLSNNVRALAGYDPATGKVLFSHDWGGDKWPKASQPVIVGEDRVFVSAGYGMGCQLIKLTAGADGAFSTEEIWSGMKMKTQFNSAALRDGHLYGLDDGRLACLDVSSGERLWKEGRFASGQSLLVNDLVIVQSESGPVHLCGAKPEGFTEYGKIDALSSKTWNHPVLSGRFLLVRNDREAVCYELPVVP